LHFSIIDILGSKHDDDDVSAGL